jgi:hypothetical protein
MDILTKQCRSCKETKPVTEYYNRKHSSDGYDPYCTVCKLKKAEKYKMNPVGSFRPKSLISEDGKTKFCGGCETTKLVQEFYKSKNTNDGISARCITCYQLNYRANKEAANQRALERYYKRIGKPMPEKTNHYSTKVISSDGSIPVVQTVDIDRFNAKREQWRMVFAERFDDIMKLLKEYDEDKIESRSIVLDFHANVRSKWKLKHKTTERYEEHFRKYGSSGW